MHRVIIAEGMAVHGNLEQSQKSFLLPMLLPVKAAAACIVIPLQTEPPPAG
jgi:hypothetical protein